MIKYNKLSFSFGIHKYYCLDMFQNIYQMKFSKI